MLVARQKWLSQDQVLAAHQCVPSFAWAENILARGEAAVPGRHQESSVREESGWG